MDSWDGPDHKLDERGRALVYRDDHRVKVEFEEDPGYAAAMIKRTSIMGDTVLVGVQRRATWGDVCCGNDMQEILIRHEC